MKKPNIMFFLTDDQRFDTIAALGNPEIKTPRIDELVAQGVAFTHGHIPGGTVPAVCMPSRAMIQTGRSMFRLQQEGAEVPKEHALLGETLKNNGYDTFGIGKWHNGIDAFARSFTDGGEIFFGGMQDHWNVPVFHFDPTGKYEGALKKVDNWEYSNKVTTVHGDHIHAGKHSSELFVDSALDCLQRWDRENPFYMYLAFMAPHDPRTMPEEFHKMYDPEKITLPDNFMEEYPFRYGPESIRCESLVAYPRNAEEIKQNIADYYGMISHLDHELGRVIDYLKEQGEYENTIIVLAGDNGLALGQHALMGKHSCYENSVRVPLVFAGPGLPKGKQTSAYAYLMDIFPTFCDMLEIPIPESVDAKSLLPAICGDETVHDALYLGFADVTRGVRKGDWKYIEYCTEDLFKQQLFYLPEDPCEIHSQMGVQGTQARVEEMQGYMLNFAEQWTERENEFGKRFWEKREKALSKL